MRRARIAIAAIAIVAPIASAYAYDVLRNLQAREELRVACADLDAATEAQWAELGPIIRELFEDRTAIVEQVIRGMGAEACPALERELASPWRWNWGRTWRARGLTEEERTALELAMDRARSNCPRVFGEMVAGLGAMEEAERSRIVEAGCTDMLDGLDDRARAELRGEAQRSVAIWDWPRDLARLARAIEGIGTAAVEGAP